MGRAVLVLGMHRSGTSALSRVVSLLGVAGPAEPMPPGPDNPRGFWEPARVTRLNDAILAAGGSSWADWTRFDADRLPPGALDALRPGMAAALHEEYGDAPLFVVKDPRLSRLLHLWAPLEGARAIITARHPAAVAASLRQRNGFTPERSALLWLRHVLDAERLTRGLPRDVVLYDALLADWRGVMARCGERLGLDWPAPQPDAIDAFLADDLRHHTDAEVAVGSAYAEVWLRHAWAALLQLAAVPEDPAALAALDRVRAQFEDACRLFAPDPLATPSIARGSADLRQVTLVAADSHAVPLTVQALQACVARCEFRDVALFTDVDVPGPFRPRRIAPLRSHADYSAFILRALPEAVSGTHALVVQWDGWVVAPEAWDPAFLQFDYIGAPWGRYADGMDVGNGGFSLRSRRLLDAVARFDIPPGVPEDELIGRVWRPVLESRHGIRFAPPDVAARFAYERVLPTAPTFGFHGLFNLWRHMDDAALARMAALLPGAVVRGRPYAELVAMCFVQKRDAALHHLGARWHAEAGPGAMAAGLRAVFGQESVALECLRRIGGLASPVQ